MPISQDLQQKLQQALGANAANDLLELLEIMDANRGDVGELRHEMQLEFANLRKEMAAGFSQVGERIAGVRADLMKWSFVFWVGAVAAIAALAGVLRN